MLKLLGAGGMGGVFLAEDTQLNRQVALKVMRPDISGRANADDRFLREARAAAAVHHDHIVTIYQVGRDGQVPYLAMEFLEGESLDDRLHREPLLPLQEVLRIGREIAVGLAAAHARGLVHRDIKPANIWLAQRGASHAADSHDFTSRVKLLDFGLARSVEANFELTSQGAIIGTPAYMAPEQARGDVVDHRADLFSLGIVLYRMATGVLPFLGKDAISTLVAIGSQSPDDPRKSRPDLPETLADLILRLLCKNPDERPSSASEVVKQLSQILVPTEQNTLPVTIQTAEFQPRRSAPPTRFRWIVAMGAMFLTCLLGGIIIVRTDGAYVELRTTVDDVDVKVKVTKPDGTVVETIDTKTGSKFTWFWSGKYQAELVGGDNSVELTKSTFTLKRGSKEVLTLTRKPATGGPSIAAPIRKKSVQPGASTSRPVSLPEPPSLAAWLKDRKVLTVAQDGSGQFKTIQAALNALQTGEVVIVLDKGPYQERLESNNLPEDCGLISDVQTILEAPEWKPQYTEKDPATGGEITVYAGHLISGANAFRLHGFEMQFPPSAGKTVRRLSMTQTRSFVLENCLFHASESFEGEPVDIGDWNAGDGVGMNVWMRDCVIEGSAAFTAHYKGPDDPERQSTIVVERNYFRGVGTEHHLMIVGAAMKNLAIRHNVFAGNATRDILLSRIGRRTQFEVSNNTLLSQNGITFGDSVPQAAVTIRNNLHSQFGFVTFQGDRSVLPKAAQHWIMDHNTYPELPVGDLHESILPRQPGDLSISPRFLSKVPQENDYLRISQDEQLATAGAGGAWPTYIGALPAGSVPKTGDWFSRLRERWQMKDVPRSETSSPVEIPEPPPLAEWLKGRKVLTVAQDGSGQFKTIQAALDALQPGETVKVLDKGPYRERLGAPTLPHDSGLVSEVQTILDAPEWKLVGQEDDPATGGKVDVYHGHSLNDANGFRWHGFEMRFPPSNGKRALRCGGVRTKSFVLENCFIHASESLESFEGEPFAISDWDKGDGAGMSVCIRDCVIEGSVGFFAQHKRLPLDPDRRSTVVVERNYFMGVGTKYHLAIAGPSMEKAVVRHNVFAGKSDIDIKFALVEASDSLEVSNNLLLSPTGIAFQECTPHGAVTIRNNVHSSDAIVSFNEGIAARLRQAARSWNMDHNAYPDLPAGVRPENVLPRPSADLSVLPRFLSKVPQEADYLRIPAGDSLATAGAGGKWPTYLGPLPPGPAPKEGDWFSRLRERAPVRQDMPNKSLSGATTNPTHIPEVPALAEWLKGREVLTVAQDGSGQHKTIDAAFRVLRANQVIKVLDRGPYKEHLRFAGMPANTGMISDQQTVIEVEDWNDGHAAHEMGPLNGFRLSGFSFLAPQASDWTIITNWIQPSGLVIEDCFFSRRTGTLDKPGPEASVQLWFNSSGPDVFPVFVRNCLIDGGAVGIGAIKGLSPTISITQNYFRRSFIGLQSEVGTVVVEHNLFESIGSSMLWIEKLTKVHNVLEISNNTVAYTAPWERNSGISFVEDGPEDKVIIRNNITDSGVCCGTTPENRALMSQRWQMDHNAYVREWGCFPKSTTDLLLNPKYLSSEPNHPNAWRIAVDSELAKGGAGGSWPAYIGAFAPGPAPTDGDWFTRIRDKWASKSGEK